LVIVRTALFGPFPLVDRLRPVHVCGLRDAEDRDEAVWPGDDHSVDERSDECLALVGGAVLMICARWSATWSRSAGSGAVGTSSRRRGGWWAAGGWSWGQRGVRQGLHRGCRVRRRAGSGRWPAGCGRVRRWWCPVRRSGHRVRPGARVGLGRRRRRWGCGGAGDPEVVAFDIADDYARGERAESSRILVWVWGVASLSAPWSAAPQMRW